MSYRLRVSFPILVLLAAILACNMPFEQVPPPSQVQTAAALTLQALLTPSITLTAKSTPAITHTASPRVTATLSTNSLTGTITPTYSVPILTVRESTNCRAGPGEDYEVIFTYLKGKELEIAVRYDPGNFWLVKSSDSPTGNCGALRSREFLAGQIERKSHGNLLDLGRICGRDRQLLGRLQCHTAAYGNRTTSASARDRRVEFFLQL